MVIVINGKTLKEYYAYGISLTAKQIKLIGNITSEGYLIITDHSFAKK